MPTTDQSISPSQLFNAAPSSVAAIVIGRNEGQRLRLCLDSTNSSVEKIIYVDSGSTDNSLSIAKSADVEILKLDDTLEPFSAARARNAGIEYVEAGNPPKFVQFIDGDCELKADWISEAVSFLETHPRAAAVCGLLKERNPDASIYNKICDDEWAIPIGKVSACGGIALFRWSALKEAGGFRATVIAGEDTELCIRLKKAGWEIWHISSEMALHDADMKRFSQWWARAVRAGHCFAQIGSIHPHHFVRERLRAVVWAAVLPLLGIAIAVIAPAGLIFIAGAYLLSFLRSFHRLRKKGNTTGSAMRQAYFAVLSKLANFKGMLTFYWRRSRRGSFFIIEHKS